MMDNTNYAYAVSRIRVLETRLLGRDKIDRMLEAANAQDAFKVLAETEYGTHMEDIGEAYKYEAVLSKEIKRVYSLIKSLMPQPKIMDMFCIKYDVHNIKVLYKNRFLNIKGSLPLIDVGSIPIDRLTEIIKEKNYKDLPLPIAQTLRKLDEITAIRPDPQHINLMLDRAMFEAINDMAARFRYPFIKELAAIQADVTNIMSFLRIKAMEGGSPLLDKVLVTGGKLEMSFFTEMADQSVDAFSSRLEYSPYGQLLKEGIEHFTKTGKLSRLEKLADDYIMEYLREHKSNPLGPEALIGYLLAKENEIKIIRIIMVGKINGIKSQVIKERLRDVYV
ncbi:MAG TPA: V-type ATP synthase subunit C [Clostridiales bacterium]|nr:V-type ATP synthase subunit C [Clostridiales bacterium]